MPNFLSCPRKEGRCWAFVTGRQLGRCSFLKKGSCSPHFLEDVQGALLSYPSPVVGTRCSVRGRLVPIKRAALSWMVSSYPSVIGALPVHTRGSGQFRYLTSVPRCTQRPDAPPSEPGVWPSVALTRRTRRSSSSETLSDSATVTRPGRRSLGGSGASRLAGPHYPEGSACPPRRWPGPGPTAGGSHRRGASERADRDIHRALALEGLRSWYMRAAVHRHQEEWVIPGWNRGMGSMPVTPQVNWEACRRSARVSQQVRGTPRALWYDPPS
ncbi:uncharacterized protein LOC122548130 [Chiloscyllium plagiosum]|uniref:uncharacterized protein LOC122548130 n=1 Tax=Chiloscyllium plagiosum TaxID=36176 RepID=UPI001CB7CC12|nr:uncharacterized protein LOC122548130 [Chiloscyllium plagiosum]